MMRKSTEKKIADAYRLLTKYGVVMSAATPRGYCDFSGSREVVLYCKDYDDFLVKAGVGLPTEKVHAE